MAPEIILRVVRLQVQPPLTKPLCFSWTFNAVFNLKKRVRLFCRNYSAEAAYTDLQTHSWHSGPLKHNWFSIRHNKSYWTKFMHRTFRPFSDLPGTFSIIFTTSPSKNIKNYTHQNKHFRFIIIGFLSGNYTYGTFSIIHVNFIFVHFRYSRTIKAWRHLDRAFYSKKIKLPYVTLTSLIKTNFCCLWGD